MWREDAGFIHGVFRVPGTAHIYSMETKRTRYIYPWMVGLLDLDQNIVFAK